MQEVEESPESRPLTDLVGSRIQDEFGPNAVVLRTAVIKQRVGKVGHSFVTQSIATAEEYGILQNCRKEREA